MSELKITVDQLKNYLGTGLIVQVGSTERNITALQDNCRFAFVTAWKGSREKQMVGIENIKPVVYRLSDLDKEIEVDGERFVPAKELAKLITQAGWDHEKIIGISSENNTIIVRWPIHVINFNELQNFFEIDTDEDFGFNIYEKKTDTVYRLREEETQYLTGNVWQMYQKLFEWHFWPFGYEYFEQGLVIDKREVTNG